MVQLSPSGHTRAVLIRTERRCVRRSCRSLLTQVFVAAGVGLGDHGERRSHGDGGAGLHEQTFHDAAGEDLHVDDRLVGVDRSDDLPPFDGLALADEPVGEHALLHVGAERGHRELGHQVSTRRTAATTSSTPTIAAASRCRA